MMLTKNKRIGRDKTKSTAWAKNPALDELEDGAPEIVKPSEKAGPPAEFGRGWRDERRRGSGEGRARGLVERSQRQYDFVGWHPRFAVL